MIITLLKAWFGVSVKHEDLGRLGGNPRFTPPRYDRANDISHGIAPGGKYSSGREVTTSDGFTVLVNTDGRILKVISGPRDNELP